ncbi:MAG: hypothetical protein ACXVDL_15405, partial [Bacteroidia bacterium]
MPTGIILTIDPKDPTQGTLLEDETNSQFPFSDPNFPKTGLQVKDHCSFDIDYTVQNPVASNMQPYNPDQDNILITTVVQGPYTVTPLQTVTIKGGGMIKGGVSIKNGKLIVGNNGSIVGDVSVEDNGSLIARNSGSITGNINMAQGTALKVVGGGMIKGGVSIKSGNRLMLENDQNGLGGTIAGTLDI